MIAAEYFFKVLAKAPVKHIPFPGGAPAMMGLLTGDVNVLAATATICLGLYRLLRRARWL